MAAHLSVPDAPCGRSVVREAPTRRHLETVLWTARFGAAWRLLPSSFGSRDSTSSTSPAGPHDQGQETGLWQRSMDRPAAESEREWRALDSAVLRADSPAAGANERREPILGRSRGGCSSKPHGALSGARSAKPRMADSLGHPLRSAPTAGAAGDAPAALPPLGTLSTVTVPLVLADHADGSDALLGWMIERRVSG